SPPLASLRTTGVKPASVSVFACAGNPMLFPRHGLRPGILLFLTLGLLLGGAGRAAAQAPKSDLPWKYDLTKGLEEARKAGKRIFIDFTGVACPPCHANEKNVFPLPEVRQRLLKFVLVKLYTDEVPEALYPPEERQKIDDDKRQADAKPNQELMAKLGGKAAP